MADVGYGALLLALLCSGHSLLGMAIGVWKRYPELVRSAESGLKLAALWIAVASAVLLYLLLAQQYHVQYVYAHVSSHMPLYYVISAFWAGQEGSLLFWLLLTAVASLVLMRTIRDEAGLRLRPYLLGTMALIEGFMALVLVLPSNPFVVLPVTPLEGSGMNPLLENWGMIFHPPVLFVGYALYTVPFSFVIAGLLSGQPSDEWMERTRRWSLMAWLFLGIGILLGAWWAYLELSWGGYWSWDPVENSSLMPWLIGTAALHSGAMQSRRGIFRGWTAAFNLLAFGLCIFATFVTRSGVIQSVHAFSRSVIGTYFIVFLLIIMLAGFAILWARRRTLASEYPMDSFLSREASFLLANLLLLGTTVVVFLGTMYPALTELFQGRQVALDRSFFDRAFSPLALVIMLLLGLCPLLGWKNTSTTRLLRRQGAPLIIVLACVVVLLLLRVREPLALVGFAALAFAGANILAEFVRATVSRHRSSGGNPFTALPMVVGQDRRRYGGLIVHLGVLLMGVAVVGNAFFQSESQVVMEPGERIRVERYTLEYVGPVGERLPDKQRFGALLNVYYNDRLAKQLLPEKNFHWNVEQWVSEVGVWSRPDEDLYIILGSVQENGPATFEILINPLMMWMWIGGGVVLAGAVLAWWPDGSRKAPALHEAREFSLHQREVMG